MALKSTPFLSMSLSLPSSRSSSFKLSTGALSPHRSRRNHQTLSIYCLAQREPLLQIQSSGIIACLRAPSSEFAVEAARAALSGGISVLEIVTTCPGALEAVKQLSLEFPRKIFGVGTVLSSADARDAVRSGAKFLMSPATIMEILVENQSRGSDGKEDNDVLYIPGAMTPTEIHAAFNSGAKIVKVYPISILGGVDFLKVLKKPFPHIPLIASQGVGIDSIEEYLNVGASAVVLSDAIFERDALRKRDFDAIHERARVAAALGGRQRAAFKNIHQPQ